MNSFIIYNNNYVYFHHVSPSYVSEHIFVECNTNPHRRNGFARAQTLAVCLAKLFGCILYSRNFNWNVLSPERKPKVYVQRNLLGGFV